MQEKGISIGYSKKTPIAIERVNKERIRQEMLKREQNKRNVQCATIHTAQWRNIEGSCDTSRSVSRSIRRSRYSACLSSRSNLWRNFLKWQPVHELITWSTEERVRMKMTVTDKRQFLSAELANRLHDVRPRQNGQPTLSGASQRLLHSTIGQKLFAIYARNYD